MRTPARVGDWDAEDNAFLVHSIPSEHRCLKGFWGSRRHPIDHVR